MKIMHPLHNDYSDIIEWIEALYHKPNGVPSITYDELSKMEKVRKYEVSPGCTFEMVFYGEKESVIKCEIKKGSIIPEVAHPDYVEIFFIESGRIIDRNSQIELTKNDTYIFHKNVPHKIEALEDSVIIIKCKK